jgi:hypothetical protein
VSWPDGKNNYHEADTISSNTIATKKKKKNCSLKIKLFIFDMLYLKEMSLLILAVIKMVVLVKVFYFQML